MYQVYSILWKIIDLLYPPHCAACNVEGVRFCVDCYSSVTVCSGPFCAKCGDQLSRVNDRYCNRCKTTPLFYRSIRSWAIYDGQLRKAIRSLKYKRDFCLGERLSEPLVELLDNLKWNIDFITAVPLDTLRVRERGYNQSKCIAQPLAYYAQLPYSNRIIMRNKFTRPQVGLNYVERQKNVKGAFRSNPIIASGKSILIVDDVITTGATINSCAESLIDAGAKKIYGLTLARAVRLLDE